MDKKHKVGIVGTGKFAGHHVDVWKSLDKIKLVGFYGSDSQRRDIFSRRFRIKNYDDYNSLIEESDVIDVVSANYTHCDYASQALWKNKAVIVEKPLDIVYEKADALCRIAEGGSLSGSVISQLRFHKSFQKLKNILKAGHLGNTLICRLTVIWPRKDEYFSGSGGWKGKKSEAGGGVLMHQCIHFIDLLHWLFGDVLSVKGRKDCCVKGGIEESFRGEIQFQRGTVCQLYLTTNPCSNSYQEMEVQGTMGKAVVRGNLFLKKMSNSKFKNAFGNAMSYAERILRGAENHNILLKRQFLNIINSFMARTDPLVTLKDGLAALRTVLGFYQSAELGKTIYLNNSAANGDKD